MLPAHGQQGSGGDINVIDLTDGPHPGGGPGDFGELGRESRGRGAGASDPQLRVTTIGQDRERWPPPLQDGKPCLLERGNRRVGIVNNDANDAQLMLLTSRRLYGGM